MTARAVELVAAADVIVHDRLIPPEALGGARPDAELLYVGKEPGSASVPQEQIAELLIERARSGKSAVRLKGGDPFVFGRGGEEAEALAEAGIPFEIVPGVSSAVAVPAYAGIPLTHRQFASSFAVVTGHEARKANSAVNWAKLATAVDTLVILMGLTNLPTIVKKLVEHGRSPQTPVAVIRSGTTSDQERVTGTLADIVEKSILIEPPALIVIGDVVSLGDQLSWFVPMAEAHRFLYDSGHARESARV